MNELQIKAAEIGHKTTSVVHVHDATAAEYRALVAAGAEFGPLIVRYDPTGRTFKWVTAGPMDKQLAVYPTDEAIAELGLTARADADKSNKG